jgi:hypothetical protein
MDSGRKSTLIERDRRILRRAVSENHRSTAAQVTGELNILLKDLVSTKTLPRELHKSNTHGRAAIVKPLITESNHKTRISNYWKSARDMVDESTFTLFPT